ncbi:diguanylate cyclase (GGDEF) domain-containing protein [Selenomonas sp. WCT3]|uniref:GGDEF domain-containing protein n=1 Tax=Selenomonas sp. WCT3 TaxID=3158785 RepID=UPI000889DEBA|nr:diguanylate cyclase (GGDEF) domain-containing protein [Selenomonas ruminantium]
MSLDKELANYLMKEGIFQQMFDVIRLVEQDGHYVCKYQHDGSCTVTDETCFSVWGKTHRCSNCVSRQAYDEERQHVKFEYAKNRYYFVIARPIWLQGKKYALELVMDVTNQFTQNNPNEGNFVMNLIHELERVSSRDPFTGLFNKNYLQKELTQALEQRHAQSQPDSPLYLAIWDIDNFKQVNDTYGHDMGDKILLSVAQALQRGLSPKDGITARFGGDEFMILFHHTDRDRCEHLLQAIKDDIDHQTHSSLLCNESTCFRVSISYGLADVHSYDTAAAALHAADQQLYDRKRKIHKKVVI